MTTNDLIAKWLTLGGDDPVSTVVVHGSHFDATYWPSGIGDWAAHSSEWGLPKTAVNFPTRERAQEWLRASVLFDRILFNYGKRVNITPENIDELEAFYV